MQSTYLTFVKVCRFHKIPQTEWHLNGQYNYIEFRNGSRIDLLDLKFLPRDPLYERFGSLEYSDGAVEEAGEVHYLAVDVLKSRVGRHLNNELGIKPCSLYTGNPAKNWTYLEFYKPWKEKRLGKSKAFIQALYKDNHFTAEAYGKQLNQIKDLVTRQRLMLGIWEYADSPDTMINFDFITDLFTNTITKKDKEKFLVCDLADIGQDRTVITLWEGLECYKIIVYQGQATDETEDDIKILLRDEKIPYSHTVIDKGGLGTGTVNHLKGTKGFLSNASPFRNPKTGREENFKNLRSQCGYKLAELVNNHKMSVKCDNMEWRDLIQQEMSQLKVKNQDKDTKRQIISKEEIKEILGHSPDFLDNLMMRMYFEYQTSLEDEIDVKLNYEYKQSPYQLPETLGGKKVDNPGPSFGEPQTPDVFGGQRRGW